MNRPQMIQWLHEQASGPMANDPRQVDTCNTLTAICLELEGLAARRQEIDDEAAGYAEEIERLRAERDTLCRAVWELSEEQVVAISLDDTLDEIRLCNRLAQIARSETGDVGEEW